jgi:hypothetical protein
MLREEGFLFRGFYRNGPRTGEAKPWHPDHAQSRFKKMIRSLGLPPYTLHSLRHFVKCEHSRDALAAARDETQVRLSSHVRYRGPRARERGKSMLTRIFILRGVSVGVAMLAAALLAIPPASAANGCTPTDPVSVPGTTDACDYVITPGGDYNANVMAQSLSVDVFAKDGALFRHVDVAGPGRQNVITADEAVKLAGGRIKAAVTNGTAVVGCAACEMPAR